MAYATKQRQNQSAKELADIHGNNFPAIYIPKAEEETILLSDLKRTGFGIYQKTQYAKLAAITDEFFDADFHTYMADVAKTYLLENKVGYLDDEILATISNCKKDLTPHSKKNSPPKCFFRDRQVEKVTESDIVIQVNNISANTPPSSSGKKSTIFTGKSSLSARQLQFDGTSEKAELTQTSKYKEKYKFRAPNQQPDSYDNTRNKPKYQHNTSAAAEYDCIVTCIDKRNCAWIRDKANDELFLKVYKMANDEAQGQETALKPWYTDKVYIALDEDSWFRCKIIRYLPLIVFFLDYGNVAQVAEIREVSEELAKIPSLAVRITFRESEYDPVLEDEIRIKIFKQNEDGTFYVNVIPKPSPPISYFQKPDNFAHLEDGLRVSIIHVDNAVLYLRTFECFAKLKQIESDIKEYIKTSRQVYDVSVNQLTLCLDDEIHEFRRAIITKIIGKKIDVWFLDYVKNRTVEIHSLRSINEKLSLEPITYISGNDFIGFKSQGVDSIAKQIIKESIEKRKKYTVVFDFDDNFDLFDGEDNLSELLQNHGRITLQDIKLFTPEFGLNDYVCGCFKSSSEFSLVYTNAVEDYLNDVFQSDVGFEPYVPLVNEICLCLYEGDWRRCVVTRRLNQQYEVLLLDFGNVELVKEKDIRKPDKNIVKTPALALPCRLINLPKMNKLEEYLKNVIRSFEIYKADIKSITDGKFDVELPSIYAKINNS